MKKIWIYILLIMLLFPIKADAQGLLIRTNKDILKPGEILEIEVYSPSRFSSMTLELDYDDEKFEFISGNTYYGEETKNDSLGKFTTMLISSEKEIKSGKFYKIKLKANSKLDYDKTSVVIKTDDCYKSDGLTEIKLKKSKKEIIISNGNSIKSFTGKIEYSIKNSIFGKIVVYGIILIMIMSFLFIYKKHKR